MIEYLEQEREELSAAGMPPEALLEIHVDEELAQLGWISKTFGIRREDSTGALAWFSDPVEDADYYRQSNLMRGYWTADAPPDQIESN